MNDAPLVTVVNAVEHLTKPDRRLFLRNALLFLYNAKKVASGRLFHDDVHPGIRLDRLQRVRLLLRFCVFLTLRIFHTFMSYE